MSDDEAVVSEQSHLLTKLNATLVGIVKQEWQISCQTFISDLCQSASQSQNRCENVLKILRLLSEEVFDFSKDTLLKSQAAEMKRTLNDQFSVIFQLCEFVINEAIKNPVGVKQTLIRECLKTLQVFLSWIPTGYIFQTDLIEGILRHLIQPASTRLEAIKLFTEVSQVDLSQEEEAYQTGYREKTCLFFCIFVEQIVAVTKGRDLRTEY